MTTAALRNDISTDLLVDYQRDGFVIVPDALSEDDVAELRADAVRIAKGESGEVEGLQPPVPGESDDDVIRRYICIHQPHKISSVMHKALRYPAIVNVLTQLIGPNVKAMQSMLFTKGEGKPGQAWHQDEFFIPSRDRSLTAAWIALDDATTENGCLWVLPGSHARGIIYPDREHDDERFDCAIEAYDFPYRDEDAVPVQIPAGTALIFNGYLLHRSLPNTGKHGMRRSLVNHYMSAESLLPWGVIAEGKHFANADYRDVVMVAGEDPYAYKGTVDRAKPHIRPTREGGCGR